MTTKNNQLAMIMLIIIGLYVLMLKRTTEAKNKILLTLVPLSLIAIFSPVFLFIILLPIFILLVLKSSNDFNPYFFTDIVSNVKNGGSGIGAMLPITDEDKTAYTEGKTDIPSYSYVIAKTSNTDTNQTTQNKVNRVTPTGEGGTVTQADIQKTLNTYTPLESFFGGGWIWKK